MSKRRDRETSFECEDEPAALPNSEPLTTTSESTKPAAEPVALLSLRVFVTVAGPKWDQMAGFVNFATRAKLGPCSMAQWREHYERFQKRAVS